jgi:hypothetical protein
MKKKGILFPSSHAYVTTEHVAAFFGIVQREIQGKV